MPCFKTKYTSKVPKITSNISFVTDTDKNNVKLKNPQTHLLQPCIPGRWKNPPDSQGPHLSGFVKHSYACLALQGKWRLGVNMKSKYILEIWERKRGEKGHVLS